MARTSRKNLSNANAQVNTAVMIQSERIFHAAAYIRLSVEDNSDSKDRESIEMQQYMVEKFIAEQPDMILYKAYVDNGETGTNFDRPGFEKMMDDIRGGAVDCIVVKDLSRFGRNYVETGYYLEKIFPYLNVRFVALNDSYDTRGIVGKRHRMSTTGRQKLSGGSSKMSGTQAALSERNVPRWGWHQRSRRLCQKKTGLWLRMRMRRLCQRSFLRLRAR